MSRIVRPNHEFALYLFGPFRLEQCNGVPPRPVRLPRHKVKALLAYLVLHLDTSGHTREKLAALFWGDTPDE